MKKISARSICGDPIQKSLDPVDKSNQQTSVLGIEVDEISPEYDPQLLEVIIRESTIIPQCKKAYRNNIAGFGIGIRYIEKVDEPTPEMKAEYKQLEELIDTLSFDKPTKNVFEEIVDWREGLGYSFLEIVEDPKDSALVKEIKEIEDPKTIKILKLDDESTEYTVTRYGKQYTRRKRFRRFKQTVNNQSIFFKEWGDPRDLDMNTGKYYEKGEIPLKDRANSILHFKTGYGVYGTPRWEGPMLAAQGSRKAELLNWRYFTNGKHTPLMLLIQGGTLNDKSWNELTEYMNSVKGENSQHGFLVLETEAAEKDTALDDTKPVTVEVKPLSEILQKDELFQDYMDNTRKKIQSSFLLPDIYVGYSQDYNVATAREATRKTEEQVFVPERENLTWILNNVILSGYGFKYVEAYFKSPNIENSDYQKGMFAIASRAMTPNQINEEYYSSINKDYTPINEEWANIPTYSVASSISNNLTSIIEKAQNSNGSDEVIAVLKEAKKQLLNYQLKGGK